jgi:hypothetical protein
MMLIVYYYVCIVHKELTMKKLIALLPVLLITACSSLPKNQVQNDEKLCRTYSDSYLMTAIMKERGFSRKKALACSLSDLTNNTDKICKRKVDDQEYVGVIRYNKIHNPAMTKWMASIVYTVYSQPNQAPYKWRDNSYKRCKSIGAFQSS